MNQPSNPSNPWLRMTDEAEIPLASKSDTASGAAAETVIDTDTDTDTDTDLEAVADTVPENGARAEATAAQPAATGHSTIVRAMTAPLEPAPPAGGVQAVAEEALQDDARERGGAAVSPPLSPPFQSPSNPFGARRQPPAPPLAVGRGRRPLILMALVSGAALLALGVTGGWWWAQHKGVPASSPADESTAATDQREVLYWYDPMMPQQRFDKPGPSPFMDMELVPMYADEAGDVAGVKIDSTVTQNLGVRLATVVQVPLSTEVEATGVVGFNERDVAVVQARTGGFVERVWPLAPGDLISAGQPLVELTVPDWVGAEYELLALKATGDIPLIAAARERLRLLGMPDEMIAKVERSGVVLSRFTVTAPVAGLVQSLDVRTGMTVMAGQDVARLNGLSKVWLEAAVPEASAGLVRVGSSASVRLAGFHEGAIQGRVTAILPTLNEASRSLRVRIELPNRDGRLRPGLTAQVSLKGAASGMALAVPTEAVIRTGKRALVMVVQGEGRYAPVEVTLGREAGDQVVIMSGLSEGQQVVASGQFLIDSEASLKGIEARSADEHGEPGGKPLMLDKLPDGAESGGP